MPMPLLTKSYQYYFHTISRIHFSLTLHCCYRIVFSSPFTRIACQSSPTWFPSLQSISSQNDGLKCNCGHITGLLKTFSKASLPSTKPQTQSLACKDHHDLALLCSDLLFHTHTHTHTHTLTHTHSQSLPFISCIEPLEANWFIHPYKWSASYAKLWGCDAGWGSGGTTSLDFHAFALWSLCLEFPLPSWLHSPLPLGEHQLTF